MHATPESFGPTQSPLAAYRLRQVPTTIAAFRCRNRFVVGQVRLNFPRLSPIPIQSASSLTGVLTVCCKPYDTAFDRFAPVSPDRILRLHATPVPRSGTVLPNLSSGSCCDNRPCERLFRLSSKPIARFRLSSTSRFPSSDFQPHGISGPHRPGDSFGFITCRLLRSASYPCRLRATAHPDRLPSSIRNPGLLNLVRVVPSVCALRRFLRALDRPIEPCGFA